MTAYKSEPLAAYDALAGTPVENDEELRPQIARQIVDTIARLRAERGLAWLRRIRHSYVYFNELVEVSNEIGPRNPDMILGRGVLWDAYEATAGAFIAAFGRKG